MVDADALLVPVEEAVDAFVNLDGMVPAQGMKLADVGEFEHRSIRLGTVPTEFATETNLADNLLGTLLDAELLAGADVDVAVAHLADAVMVGDELALVQNVLEIDVQEAMHRGIGHLFTPEELAHGRARTP